MYTALIIDTLSIQSYIFGSNKLKENIGGSYIIEHLVYKKMIPLALEQSGITSSLNMEEWTSNDGKDYKLIADPSSKVEIGYVGGGNTLMIFRNEGDAESFVKVHSKLLLQYFPGLKVAYAVHPFDYQEGETYRTFLMHINQTLSLNRSLYPVASLPFKHGIVDDCAWSNEAQEVKDNATGNIISRMSASRVAVVKDSQEKLMELLNTDQKAKYTFTAEQDLLGQPDDKGYIAIVHADGNGMGIRFRNCNSLAETRRLSAGVLQLANSIMKELINYVITIVEKKKIVNFELREDKEDSDKKILPIRPLIAGGDDITFVCEGRLGVHLAEKLLELMTTTKVNEEYISACAGVAIVHTKYPFYKAYQLADELTHEAKNACRPDNSSWLHYMISTGGFSGTYEDIIANQYTLPGNKKLKNGPYRIDEEKHSIKDLKNGMKYLTGTDSKHQWPMNKIRDLRDVLRKDTAFQEYFLAEMKARKLKLPSDKEVLWEEGVTPFHDMVELLDFYPKELL